MKVSNARSFSASVKEELIRMPAGRACCMLSEISALTQTSGHLSFRGGGWISASYRVDNAGTARRLFQLLKKRLNVTPSLHFTQTRQLGGRRTCVLSLGTEDTRILLNALHMAETDEDGHIHIRRTVPRHPLTRQCCGRAFLRGAFLGAGTVTNPEKGYNRVSGGSILGCKHSEELKRDNRIAIQKRYERDPDYSLRNQESKKKVYENRPELREAISQTMKRKAKEGLLDAFLYGSRKPKPVICIETGVVYPSQSNAEKVTGLKNIHKTCHGHSHTSGGMHWRYV